MKHGAIIFYYLFQILKTYIFVKILLFFKVTSPLFKANYFKESAFDSVFHSKTNVFILIFDK